MKQLTKAEEQIMQILWDLKEGFVNDIIAHFPDPKPAYNTVSTIVRILEKKGFVGHNTFGKSHQYFPSVSRDEYTSKFLKGFVSNYFSNSFKSMVSFFSKETDMDVSEMEDIMALLRQEIENKKSEKS